MARSLLLLGLLAAGAFATCSGPSGIFLQSETWVPETPYVGEASYIVVNGTNNQASSFTWAHCQIEVSQGSYSYGSNGFIPCWTDEVKPGANFRFQTGAVWVPADAPLGEYTWELTTYDLFGNEGGCWSGTLTVAEDPNNGVCVAATGIFLQSETWVPETPYVGEASYIVVNGTNNQATSFTWTRCQVTISQGAYSYGSDANLPCWTDVVKPGANFRFQTGAIWVPSDAPLGEYTWQLTPYDFLGNAAGCWSGTLTVAEDPNPNNGVCVAATGILLQSETWVPETPYVGEASFIVVNGTNNQATSFTWIHCQVTISQGAYSYGSDANLPCWTDEVKPGANFRFQTGAIWVPADAPLGEYTWQLTPYDFLGNAAGCWSGTLTVAEDPNPHLSDLVCVDDNTIALRTETWVPITPYPGQNSYMVLNGTNLRPTPVTFRYGQVTLSQVNGYATYSTPGLIDGYSGPVAAGASIRFQTGSISIPNYLPVGDYISYYTALDWNQNVIGCFTGIVTLQPAPTDEGYCSPGIFAAHTETWVPTNPQRGNETYVVVAGVNTAQYTANAYSCIVTFTQDSYSFSSNGKIACWTGPVASGQNFRVQTGGISVPSDALLGTYSTQIQAYGLDGSYVGCWTGAAFVVDLPTVVIS